MRKRKREEIEAQQRIPFQQQRTPEETMMAAIEMRRAIATTVQDMFDTLPQVWAKPEGALGRLERQDQDRGAILIIVLVIAVVLSMVVVGVANYAGATLRYGRISEQRTHRVAAAQAAMDDAIERLELKRSLCATSVDGPQPINPQFPMVNGATASVTCQVVAGALPATDGWALVITGEGAGDTEPTFETDAGGKPIIEGPIYTHDYKRIDIAGGTSQARLTLTKGDLWYQDAACAGGTDPDVLSFKRSAMTVQGLQFLPTTRGLYCINQSWDDLFGDVPPTADLAAMPLAAPALDDGLLPGTCKVFFPGRYTEPPVLADNNYFMSGDYLFDNIGQLDVKAQRVTIGNVPTSDDFTYPLLTENSECDAERLADPANGATLYMSGNSHIKVSSQSSFEVSNRPHGDYRVSMQAVSSTLPFSTPLFGSDSGNNKNIAFNGLVWAPYAAIDFGTVAAKKDAVLRGGAVVASFKGTISNSQDGGFLIKAGISQASSKVLLISTATLDGAVTTVNVVADWRPTTGQLAVNSWRVVN